MRYPNPQYEDCGGRVVSDEVDATVYGTINSKRVPINALRHGDHTYSLQTTERGRSHFSPDVDGLGHKRLAPINYLGGGASRGIAHRLSDLLGGDVKALKGIIMKTDATNDVTLYIGGLTMGSEAHGDLATHPQGIPLNPGEAFFIDITRLSSLYVICGTNPVGASGYYANTSYSTSDSTIAIDNTSGSGGSAPSSSVTTTNFPVGSIVYKSDGTKIGVVASTGAGSITFTSTLEVALGNTDQLYTSQVYLYWMDM